MHKTSIGSGRLAWNIQDATIVTKHLGFTIDIACSGIDNLVRHHDHNTAVVESISGSQFSRYWLHSGHLFVNGKKMSKSLGNVYYTSDVLAEGFLGTQLRFFLIYGDYRRELDFTFENLTDSSRRLDDLHAIVADLQKKTKQPLDRNSDEPYVCRVKEETSLHERRLRH
ncbi:MAG: class I tRNA ligase family protein [Crenarchaeota archaeon]|nr:class I tRNA ligase family protein [Thermoproteota archaeon]